MTFIFVSVLFSVVAFIILIRSMWDHDGDGKLNQEEFMEVLRYIIELTDIQYNRVLWVT